MKWRVIELSQANCMPCTTAKGAFFVSQPKRQGVLRSSAAPPAVGSRAASRRSDSTTYTRLWEEWSQVGGARYVAQPLRRLWAQGRESAERLDYVYAAGGRMVTSWRSQIRSSAAPPAVGAGLRVDGATRLRIRGCGKNGHKLAEQDTWLSRSAGCRKQGCESAERLDYVYAAVGSRAASRRSDSTTYTRLGEARPRVDGATRLRVRRRWRPKIPHRRSTWSRSFLLASVPLPSESRVKSAPTDGHGPLRQAIP